MSLEILGFWPFVHVLCDQVLKGKNYMTKKSIGFQIKS